MLRLYVAWRLFRLVRVALALGLVLAFVAAVSHGQFGRVGHALSGPGLSTLQRDIQRDVQRAVQHALRPAPAAAH
jgi:hypothetical protein